MGGLSLRASLPSLAGATAWVGDPPQPEEWKGQPVLVHFWAISCALCKTGIPRLNEWARRFPELRVVGIHMPRSEKDTNDAEVRQMITELEIDHPQGIDNQHAVVDAFQNEYVPAYYVFDGKHALRHRSAGEHGLAMLQKPLFHVLKEMGIAGDDDEEGAT